MSSQVRRCHIQTVNSLPHPQPASFIMWLEGNSDLTSFWLKAASLFTLGNVSLPAPSPRLSDSVSVKFSPTHSGLFKLILWLTLELARVPQWTLYIASPKCPKWVFVLVHHCVPKRAYFSCRRHWRCLCLTINETDYLSLCHPGKWSRVYSYNRVIILIPKSIFNEP